MNKHLHRIVFNAARGLRMVVQETAKSTGRGARKATSGAAGASSAAVSVAAFAAALMSAPLHAQIVADPGAPGRQRPTVLVAPNGVPVVNIQTPSAAGVSRNAYSQFDVQRNGAILNNSRGNAQTQLGGWVQGNPWLATGSARVILNEVHSANPSQLRGYVEVAGPRTEVIIANPAGIQVQGGGFINVNRATLTTGTPQFNAQGGLDSFVVRGGTVSIDGAGLDASKTDYAAILARAVQVNAGIWANELKVVAGVRKRDLLQELHQKKLNEEEADEALSGVLDSDSAGDVKDIFLLSDIEWTAKAQGADWGDVARWRYEGWPKKCPKCGADLNVRQFGWRVLYIDDAAFLAHIRCPNATD